MRLDFDHLISACRDDTLDAGVSVRAMLEPLSGAGGSVKPPTYAPASGQRGPQLQRDRRWWGVGPQRRPVDVIVVDNVPSQANRVETALQRIAPDVGLPEVVLDLGLVGALPSHVPTRLSSFIFPHRNADAYLRDAVLDGTPFPGTDEGRSIFAATATDPSALLRWFPQSLVFGFWQSHLGRRGSQAKLARSWTSEIVGYEPAADDVRQQGLKGDPLNLAKGEPVYYNRDDQSQWALGTGPKGATRADLSDIGHGQVPVSGDDMAPAGVSFSAIEQRSTLSLAGLRRVWVGTPAASAAARAVVAAVALLGHAHAFFGAFSLRSGADLRATETTWTWLGTDGDVEVEPPTVDDVDELFAATVAHGERQGLPVGGGWDPRELVLTPNDQLVASIRATYAVDG